MKCVCLWWSDIRCCRIVASCVVCRRLALNCRQVEPTNTAANDVLGPTSRPGLGQHGAVSAPRLLAWLTCSSPPSTCSGTRLQCPTSPSTGFVTFSILQWPIQEFEKGHPSPSPPSLPHIVNFRENPQIYIEHWRHWNEWRFADVIHLFCVW